MGLYDSVLFKCPSCRTRIEVVSKSGDCNLTAFDCTAVPLSIAEDIDGSIVTCPNCGVDHTVLNLLSVRKKHIPMSLK